MKKTVFKILESLILLIFLLMIPLVIKSTKGSQNLSLNKGISAQAATLDSSNVFSSPESSILHLETKDINDIKKYALYTLVLLFIISISSFIKYKISKDLKDIHAKK